MLGDPDCEFHEQTTDNLVSIIAGDPYGLPERLVKSLFQDFAGTVESSSYRDCLQEGTLSAEKTQQVSFGQPHLAIFHSHILFFKLSNTSSSRTDRQFTSQI